MRGREMNLRHLRAFMAVCHAGGISAAAGSVHLSQPAITQAISKLERGLDTRLFDRSNRGMFPTDAARALLRRVERAFDFLITAARKRREDRARTLVHALTSTQLRALVAVAEHGNYSVAARAEGVSQPSLHRAARDLEALSGETLFRKSPQGVTLSPYAAGLLRGARLGFAELDQAIEELHELRGERAGMLRIGSLPLPLGTVLPAALNRITADRPDIRISVRDSPYAGLLFALRNGDLDVILGALRTPDPAPDVEQEELFRDRLGIFCAPGHPLAGTTPDKAALSRCQWVVARDKTPTRVHFDRFFAQQGLVPAVESNSMLLVRLLLSGSDKLTMMSRTQVDEHLQSGALVELPIRLGDAPRPIGMTYRRDWQPTRAQAEFLHAARAAGAETAGRNRLWEY